MTDETQKSESRRFAGGDKDLWDTFVEAASVVQGTVLVVPLDVGILVASVACRKTCFPEGTTIEFVELIILLTSVVRRVIHFSF